MGWEDADKQCDRIRDLLHEAVESLSVRALDQGMPFFESVKEKTAAIQETIVRKGRVTTRQREALNNMEAGVEAWMR